MPDNAEQQGFQIGGERDDLFSSAASYYAKFRRACPPIAVSYLVEQFGLDGRGRMLDVGCGTGQVFQPLAKYFAEIVAIDADHGMVDYALKCAHDLDPARVKVVQMRAEEIDEKLGSFRVVIFGSSFHWMDRERVSDRVYEILEPGGYLVLLCPGEIHSGTTPWEMTVREVLKEWLGPERRAGSGVYRQSELHQHILERTRFKNLRITNIPVRERSSIDQLVGYLFSTSYASPAVLGENKEGFEQTIRQRLLQLRSDGQFEKVVEYTIISAQRPA
jgi:SAM-dependent methyltransferase